MTSAHLSLFGKLANTIHGCSLVQGSTAENLPFSTVVYEDYYTKLHIVANCTPILFHQFYLLSSI